MARTSRSVTSVLLLFACLGCSGLGPVPQFAYQESRGCGDLLVYTWNGEGTEVLAVEIDRKQVSFETGVAKVFDLGQRTVGVRAVLELYGSGKHNWHCSDVLHFDAETPETWTAVAGSLSVTIGTADPVSGGYPVTLNFKDAAFQTADGRIIRAGRPLTVFGGAGNSVGG